MKSIKVPEDSDHDNAWADLELARNKEYPRYFNDIDQDVAQKTECPKCHKFMKYEGYWNERRSRYWAAFSVCDDCGFTYLF